jgi:hypothetical protein
VGVAGQIGQHVLRPGERPLAIDEPLGRGVNTLRDESKRFEERPEVNRT